MNKRILVQMVCPVEVGVLESILKVLYADCDKDNDLNVDIEGGFITVYRECKTCEDF